MTENCALLGHYAAISGNFSQAFRDNLSVLSYLQGLLEVWSNLNVALMLI